MEYPFWFLWFQGDLVRRRINRDIKTRAIFNSLAHGANKSRKANKQFNSELEKLDV